MADNEDVVVELQAIYSAIKALDAAVEIVALRMETLKLTQAETNALLEAILARMPDREAGP